MKCDQQWLSFLVLTGGSVFPSILICVVQILIYQLLGANDTIGFNYIYMIGILLGTLFIIVAFFIFRCLSNKSLTILYIIYSIYDVLILALGIFFFFHKNKLIQSTKKLWDDDQYLPIIDKIQTVLSCCGLTDPLPKNITCNTNLARCFDVIQIHLSTYSIIMFVFWCILLLIFGFIIAALVKMICVSDIKISIDDISEPLTNHSSF